MRLAVGLVVGLACSTTAGFADGSPSMPGEAPTRKVGEVQRVTPSELGLALDYSGVANVVDSLSGTVVTAIAVGASNSLLDCVISPDGSHGYATDFNHHLWIFDLASTPPKLAEGVNPITITPRGEGVASTPDGRMLVICAGNSDRQVSVVDAVSRTELSALDIGDSCQGVDVCRDGSVLVSVRGQTRRYVLDATGHLTDTGERMPSDGGMHITCSPDGDSAIVANAWSSNIQSFRVHGLTPVSQAYTGSDWAISGVLRTDGTMYFVRGVYNVYAYAYSPAEAILGSEIEFTLPSEYTAGYYGVSQIALDHSGGKLYVPVSSKLDVFDTASGAALSPISIPSLTDHTGVCFRPRGDQDGDGLLEDDEIALGTDPTNPDTDGDGLWDGFEVRYGFAPLVPGEQLLDGDGDGLDNLGEQAAHTDPTDLDSDDDGMSDGQEIHVAGTDPLDPDTDRDRVLDGADNCPSRANADQADRVHPNAVGDVCDDGDGDGIADHYDNCADVPNADQADLDHDGRGDVCDPYPSIALKVLPVGPTWGLTGARVPMTFRLVDARDGTLLNDVSGVRATLTVQGSAIFGTSTTGGLLISGGGTARVLVEFVNGLVAIELQDQAVERVTMGAEDSEHNGISALADVVQPFETSDGGYTHAGTNDGWEWGIPTSGPFYATSGQKVWATNLAGNFPWGMNAGLVSPSFLLDVNGSPRLEFQSWLELNQSFSTAEVQVTADGGASWTTLERYETSEPAWTRKAFDLAPFVGKTIQVRFVFQSTFYDAPGWYLDDVTIRGIGKTLEFVSPEGDLDGDGLVNTEEIARGTNPHKSDTDGDYVSDGAEVHTYGTSPLERDTDGGGRADGDEIDHGADPRNPADDSRPERAMIVDNSDGVVVFDSNAQSFVASVAMEYGVGDCVISRNGTLGYVTDFAHKIWVVDLTTSPPRLAGGRNPIVTTTPPEDIAMTADGRYLVTIDGNEAAPLSVIDVAARSEIGTFELDGVYNAVEICNDGSVLVASYLQQRARRLVIDHNGRLSDTGESIAAPYAMNIYCAPDARSGIVLAGYRIRSFTIPGLSLVDEREIGDLAVCGATTIDGKRFVVRTHYLASYAFDYDPETAHFAPEPAYTVGLGEVTPYYGIEQLAIDGSRLYAPYDYWLYTADAHTGEILDSPFIPEMGPYSAGICFRPLGDFDGDGVGDYDELTHGLDPRDPDSDGDGLSDGFETRNGLDPHDPADALADPDGDGLRTIDEQEAHTDPHNSDTDDDGLSDGVEVIALGTNPHDPDSDDDSVLDSADNCPLRANVDQADTVHPNGIGDACDDPDGDSKFDVTDNCPDAPNVDQSNADGDTLGDACDPCTDPDGDGLGDPGFPTTTCPIDNCPAVANPAQEDQDLDGRGDACDNCPMSPNGGQADIDGDDIGDVCDSCPHAPNRSFTDFIVNGGFESGTLSGWTVDPAYPYAIWIVNNGTTDPPGPTGTIAPISGRFDAGYHAYFIISSLTQVVHVPQHVRHATLRWSDRIYSYAPFDEFRGWRVSIGGGATGTGARVYSTSPSDPQVQAGPNIRSVDVTGLLQTLEGQDASVTFEASTYRGYLDIALDDVQLILETPVDCHAPVAQAGVDQRVACAGPLGTVVHLDGVGSSDPDSTPGTTDGIASYEWFEDYGGATQRSLGVERAIDPTLPLGVHRITLRVTDILGEFDTDETNVSVILQLPPVKPRQILDDTSPDVDGLRNGRDGFVKRRRPPG